MNKALVLSLATVGMLQAGSAWAADPKTYPGAFCQGTTGSLTHNSIGRIQNSGPGAAGVVCPIVRDDNSAAGNAWTSATLTLTDNSNVSGASCTAYSRTVNGASAFFSSASTAAAFTGVTTLSFAPVAKNPSGYYYIYCSLPGQVAGFATSTISSYRVIEPNPVAP